FEATRFATGRRNRHTFEIYGSEGALAWDMEDMNRIQFYSQKDDEKVVGFRDILATERCHDYVNNWWPPGHIIGYEHAFVHAVVDFMDAIADNEEITPNFADGVKITRVLEAALASSDSGSRVDL
ncbi:MAG: gfo/Idh/MocA family oxidoreductase, partial [Verrucomicrobiales bacterium]|nr:gfo/Idh/MocA family oxidoreductase [Verrucomicrobiales bacterium]